MLGWSRKLKAQSIELKPSFARVALSLLLVAVSFNGPLAVAAEPNAPVGSPAVLTETCLRDEADLQCSLSYGFKAIEFHAIGDEVIARFDRLNGDVNEADVVVMSSHLEDAALNERIDFEDVAILFAQLQKMAGARYEAPSSAIEVKRSLGFSEETPIAMVDWYEILKVHVERTLSTTPALSELVLDLLKVEIREEPQAQVDGSNPIVVETN